jgi:flavorubredoxin
METKINEIADGIYRLSTYVPNIAPPAGFTFNQFLVLGDDPLMFHTGLRKMFPLNRDALSRIISPERLRWIAFGHFEADECGSMNEWLAAAPQATPAHGQTGCMVSLNDFADRTARVLTHGEVVDLGGGKRVRFIDTPHTPHGWDAGVLYEESTRTLMCGDLFTQLGNDRADRRRCCRAGDRRGGHVQVFLPQSRHGRDHPQPFQARAAHAGTHARSLLYGRRRRRPACLGG